LTQRKTQTPAYWQEQFSVSTKDIEFIYHQILEQNHLFNLDDIAIALVKRHCDAEEVATRSELQLGRVYQPNESFAVNEPLVFPLFDFALGTVQYTRPGHHPEYGNFTVLGVTFQPGSAAREFVADFPHDHPLNVGRQSLSNLQGLLSPEELFQQYQSPIRAKIKVALRANNDFVEFHEQYFLRDMLAEFHEGLFNIADAAIDINNGPLNVNTLIEQMGLAEASKITDVLRFSVNYRLDSDERFDDVGPDGQVLWYLRRLEPVEAYQQPRRLQAKTSSYDVRAFDDTLRSLLTDIDDETTNPTDIPLVGPDIDQVTLTLNYPHRRAGTLPLTPKTQSFFPMSFYNPVRFEFIDGRTGDAFPGWTVLSDNYILGLADWYQRHNLPVGAYIQLKRTADPMRVIVDYRAIRPQRDWIRMAVVSNYKLSFQMMNKETIRCQYDELMIIGEANQADLDRLWLNTTEKAIPVYDLLCQLFPELSKLNPQSTVHVKTLYSAVNVIRRAAPGLIFQELTRHRCFIPMNHGYWVYDPELRD
jgi:hypothetical protein